MAISWRRVCLAAAFTATLCCYAMVASGVADARDVVTYHGSITRDGQFVAPDLTYARVRSIRLDRSFHPLLAGHIYAQPLYWREGARAFLLVATESDQVYALDAVTGSVVWRNSLGEPVPRSSLPCGNIDPVGVTGTPTIDSRSKTMYLDAMVRDLRTGAPEHEIFALSLDDGSVLPGWPVKVDGRLAAKGEKFISRDQNQRGALSLLGDELYVPFGGNFGDCGDYHGWVIGVDRRDPSKVISWRTKARGGAIWAPAGASSDGKSLYVATGNTIGAAKWGDGEAVIRLSKGLHFSGSSNDFFTPRNWRRLDARDEDLGGTTPTLISTNDSKLVLALGKDGYAYLLNRARLGGVGGSVLMKKVSVQPIRTATASYSVGSDAMVAFQGSGLGCPVSGETGLTSLRIRGGVSPTLKIAWCAHLHGRGAPIVTTMDGARDPIIWILGAEGDNRLYGFRGDTGERLFKSATLSGLRHFQTIIATKHRFYVAADERVYAFDF